MNKRFKFAAGTERSPGVLGYYMVTSFREAAADKAVYQTLDTVFGIRSPDQDGGELLRAAFVWKRPVMVGGEGDAVGHQHLNISFQADFVVWFWKV